MATPTLTFRASIASDASSWLELVPKELAFDASLAARLPALWRELIADEAIEARTIVFDNGPRESIEAFGASVFLRPGLVEEITAHPQPGLAARIYRAIERGEQPILAGRNLARANSTIGVDVCVLHLCQRIDSLDDVYGQQLLAMGHAAFRDAHLGYNVRSIVHENVGMHRAYQLASGFELLHDFAANGEGGTSYLVGMTRERSLAEPAGSPISFLFRSTPPRYFFSASERRVLRSAIAGSSDAETAAARGVSLNAIKSTWKKVFERVEMLAPAERFEATQHRRRQLLDYLRQHPEELRPYLRPPNWPVGVA
jgi:hypothetical protein